jgi:AcrR family transcriptional regulator
MSPRSAESNKAIREERRAAIMDTALIVFAERGFEGTRIQDIADRCGLSYGLVYRYFPSKEQIFTAMVEMALEAAGRLAESLPKGTGPEALAAFVGIASAYPSPLYFALVAQALSDKSVPEELAAQARERVAGIAAAIAKALALKDAKEAKIRAEGIIALLLGSSIMQACGLSDGSFAASVAGMLAKAEGKDHGTR